MDPSWQSSGECQRNRYLVEGQLALHVLPFNSRKGMCVYVYQRCSSLNIPDLPLIFNLEGKAKTIKYALKGEPSEGLIHSLLLIEKRLYSSFQQPALSLHNINFIFRYFTRKGLECESDDQREPTKTFHAFKFVTSLERTRADRETH